MCGGSQIRKRERGAGRPPTPSLSNSYAAPKSHEHFYPPPSNLLCFEEAKKGAPLWVKRASRARGERKVGGQRHSPKHILHVTPNRIPRDAGKRDGGIGTGVRNRMGPHLVEEPSIGSQGGKQRVRKGARRGEGKHRTAFRCCPGGGAERALVALGRLGGRLWRRGARRNGAPRQAERRIARRQPPTGRPREAGGDRGAPKGGGGVSPAHPLPRRGRGRPPPRRRGGASAGSLGGGESVRRARLPERSIAHCRPSKGYPKEARPGGMTPVHPLSLGGG